MKITPLQAISVHKLTKSVLDATGLTLRRLCYLSRRLIRILRRVRLVIQLPRPFQTLLGLLWELQRMILPSVREHGQNRFHMEKVLQMMASMGSSQAGLPLASLRT